MHKENSFSHAPQSLQFFSCTKQMSKWENLRTSLRDCSCIHRGTLCCVMYIITTLAVTNIKFEMSEYTFMEGQSSWCLEVRKVGTPATEDFLVDYEFGM